MDILGKSDNVAVVGVGSVLEVEFELFKGGVQVGDEFLDGINEFFDGSFGLGVHLN